MSQLSGKLDSLLQDAKRAIQWSPDKQQQSRQQEQPAASDGELITTSPSPASFDMPTRNAALENACNERGAAAPQLDAVHQLAALRQQYELKQQEVEVLQAQIQRLCSFVEAAVASESSGNGQCNHEAELKQHIADLSSQLDAANNELQQCQTQLHASLDTAQQLQSMLATASAAKAGLERRAGALKLLLAEQITENASLIKGLGLCQEALETAYVRLQEVDQKLTAAQADSTSKDEDIRALHLALQTMSNQLADLSEHHQGQQVLSAEPPGRAECQPEAPEQSTTVPTAGQQQQMEQTVLIAKQQQDLKKQQQDLALAAQQLQEVCALLALKEDSLAHYMRHCSCLEQQLRSAKQQLAESQAQKPNDGSTEASEAICHSDSVVSCLAKLAQGSSLPAARLPSSSIPGSPIPQAEPDSADSQYSLRILTTNVTAIVSEASAAVAENTSSPRCGDQLSAFSPFAKARGFLAQREADAVARLKDELWDKEQHVKELANEVERISSQVHGLQTLITAKTGQCNRLENEARQLEKQLKQAQAAAASEHAALQQQLALLSDEVVRLESQLGASQQREQQTQQDLIAVRSKLAQVLDALVQEAQCVQKHKPQVYSLYSDDMPAALADITRTVSMISTDDAAAASLQAAELAVTSSAAAALTVLGSVPDKTLASVSRAAGNCSTAGEPSTPSNGGGLFSNNKFFGLLGRRTSTGVTDMGAADRGVAVCVNRRTSGEYPRVVTPSSTVAMAGVVSAFETISRAASDAAGSVGSMSGCGRHGNIGSRAPTPPQVQGSCVQQLNGVVDCALAELTVLEEADENVGRNSGSAQAADAAVDEYGERTRTSASPGDNGNISVKQSNCSTEAGPCMRAVGVALVIDENGNNRGGEKGKASLPGPVAEKLDALKEILHKLAPGRDRAQ